MDGNLIMVNHKLKHFKNTQTVDMVIKSSVVMMINTQNL